MTATLGLTAEIGAFLAGISPGSVPGTAAATVRDGFIDCIAVMIAGWEEPAARIVRGAMIGERSGDTALAFFGLEGAAPELALAYATAAHALDYDDTALSGHPSAVLVPAILAEGRAGGADGPLMIAAYVAGYEVWAELIARDEDQHHRKGWHPSAVFGPLAAAAAASVLMGLDAGKSRHAIGIAASMAGGIVGNFGTMTKPFQLGRAAQSGVLAARLARAGLTAAEDALESETGFLQAISPRGRVDRRAPSHLGIDWRIARHGLNLKLYPVCYAMHRALDAMAALRAAHGFAATDVASIDIEMGDTAAMMLRHHRPRTPLEAKFSAEFGMAAIAISGHCGMAQLSEAFLLRDDLRELLQRVSVTPLFEKDPDQPAHSPYDRVSVTLRDGSILQSEPVAHPLGHFRRPAGADSLWRKFEECAAPTMGREAARRLFDRLSRLDRAASVDGLLGLETDGVPVASD
jgi:2-methylcitrate dehydratase PrpD